MRATPSPLTAHGLTAWQEVNWRHPQMEHATVECQIQLQKPGLRGITEGAAGRQGGGAWPSLRCALPFNYKFSIKICATWFVLSAPLLIQVERRSPLLFLTFAANKTKRGRSPPTWFAHFAEYCIMEPHDVFKSLSLARLVGGKSSAWEYTPKAKESRPAIDSLSRESQTNRTKLLAGWKESGWGVDIGHATAHVII